MIRNALELRMVPSASGNPFERKTLSWQFQAAYKTTKKHDKRLAETQSKPHSERQSALFGKLFEFPLHGH